MQGDFGIADGRFTNQETQRKMEKLSEQARGQNQEEEPADVISELKGHLVLQDRSAEHNLAKERWPRDRQTSYAYSDPQSRAWTLS